MSKHLITVEVDTDRDQHGSKKWGADYGDTEVKDFVQTFGGEPGAQWDYPPYTRILNVQPMTGEAVLGAEVQAGGASYVVEVEGREDGNYLFVSQALADRFAAIVKEQGGEVRQWEETLNGPNGLALLISAETDV